MPTQFITNPRRPTKASSALTDTEKRDLRAAIVWAMDVDADGGEVPADIDRLFHADKWGNLTAAQARKVLRWFYATAPSNFVGNPRAAASEGMYVVDTSPSGKVVTIRDATRDEIRLGDAMPHDQAVYWAGVFASETLGAKIRDTSSHAKKNPRSGMKIRRNSALVAGTVLVQERKVRGGTRVQALVLKRGVTAPWLPNYWNLPGGGVDPGETAMQGAARECEEEISLVPQDLRPLATYRDPEGWTLETFVTDRWKGKPVVTWESDGYAWVSLDDLPHMRFVPGVREALELVFRTGG